MPDDRCGSCSNYAEAGNRHRWKWWEITPAIVLAGTMIGGWIWFWSYQDATAKEHDRRLIYLERAKETEDLRWTEIATRLTGIETTLQWMKEKLPGH